MRDDYGRQLTSENDKGRIAMRPSRDRRVDRPCSKRRAEDRVSYRLFCFTVPRAGVAAFFARPGRVLP